MPLIPNPGSGLPVFPKNLVGVPASAIPSSLKRPCEIIPLVTAVREPEVLSVSLLGKHRGGSF